jgi:hypothetical protein
MPVILAAEETEIRKKRLGSKTKLEKVLETLPQKNPSEDKTSGVTQIVRANLRT